MSGIGLVRQQMRAPTRAIYGGNQAAFTRTVYVPGPSTRTNSRTNQRKNPHMIWCAYDFVYDANIERLHVRYDSKNEFVYCLVSSLS
jgi:hypothetical protein